MANIPSSAGQSAAPSTTSNGQTYRGPFAIMTVLFFMWGFMTVWNDILIPRFKEAFAASTFKVMLIQSAFFGAYGIGSLVYFIISVRSGDPINRIGYKNGVIIGLLIAAFGSALFFPGAILTSFPIFLVALFVVGLGFAVLQIAANPYVMILGPERTASSRLNLSQGFNSIGTTIGPVVAAYLIYHKFDRPGAHGAESVKIPYLCFAGVFVLLAIFFKFAHLPAFSNPDRITGWGALKHPHTALGMLAIFMYVGAEVTIGSAIVLLLGTPALGGLSHENASNYLSFYWGGLMIGRFMGAFALSDMRSSIRHVCVVAVPIFAFIFITALPTLARIFTSDAQTLATISTVCSWSNVCHYGILLAVLIVAFFLGESSPHRMLALFSVIIIILLGTGLVTAGDTAKWAVLGTGMFCSVMWSNIFALAIEGLGPLKSQGSSLLVMGILGAAVLPPLQGKLADKINIQTSFVVPAIAVAYLCFYGVYGYRAGRSTAEISR